MADGASHPLADGCPEDWATSWGEDRYGIFMGFTVGGVEQRLRWVGPGTFWMGSEVKELGRFEVEGPRHLVTLSRGYWIADTPVTQALWTAVMGDNPSHFEGNDTRPVETVSWDDCQAFCNVLNRRIPGLGVRLPTEAEWERACRAGTDSATYTGNLDDEIEATALEHIAWYSGNGGDATHAVKQKQPNAWGLYDMLGNVWEWCQDYAYRRYSSKPQQDPRGPASGVHRVVRGGSWLVHARSVRAAFRYGGHPGRRFQDLGLRLVRDQAKRG